MGNTIKSIISIVHSSDSCSSNVAYICIFFFFFKESATPRNPPSSPPRPSPDQKNPAMSIYDQDLDKNPANYVPLSPVSFVERSAEVFGDLPAVVHGRRRYSWRDTRERAARLEIGRAHV